MSLKLPSIKRTYCNNSYNPCVDEYDRNNLSSDKDYSKYSNSLECTPCSFIFLKGKNKGHICGKKTTDELGLRCSQHKFS